MTRIAGSQIGCLFLHRPCFLVEALWWASRALSCSVLGAQRWHHDDAAGDADTDDEADDDDDDDGGDGDGDCGADDDGDDDDDFDDDYDGDDVVVMLALASLNQQLPLLQMVMTGRVVGTSPGICLVTNPYGETPGLVMNMAVSAKVLDSCSQACVSSYCSSLPLSIAALLVTLSQYPYPCLHPHLPVRSSYRVLQMAASLPWHTHSDSTKFRQHSRLGYGLKSRVCERFRFNGGHASGLF